MSSDPRGSRIRRLLVLNRTHIGDCLLTTPALRALRRRFPEARLDVAVPRANEDLLSGNPYVNDLVFRPDRTAWSAKIAFALEVRRRDYDMVISFQEKSLFYGWLAGMSGAPHRVGLEHPRTRHCYTQTVPVPTGVHEVEKYLAVTRALGCAPPGRSLDLLPAGRDAAWAREFLVINGFDDGERFVGVHPGATEASKRWPAARFAAAAARLMGELDAPALILGGPEDVAVANAIAEALPGRALVAAGETTLGETASLMERCAILLTNDTGPMHMAAALAVPVVAVWGPTNLTKFAPISRHGVVVRGDTPCARCSQPCVHSVPVDHVIAAAMTQCLRTLAGSAVRRLPTRAAS